MSRNRHSRINDHFGFDVDTAIVLDGPVGDIPSGTTVHDALKMIQSGGTDSGDLEPPNWADPEFGALVYYPSFVSEELLTGETVTAGHSGGTLPNNLANANDRQTTLGAGHFSQTQSERVSFAGSGTITYWWGVDFGVARAVSGMRIWSGVTGSWILGSGFTHLIEWSDDGSAFTSTAFTRTTGSVSTGNTFPYATSADLTTYELDVTSTHRHWRIRKTGAFGLQFFGGDHMVSWYIDGPSEATWVLGPNIQDADPDTYHEATYGAECMRVALLEPLLIEEAIVRIAFPTGAERTYGFYGTNSSDYSGGVLLDELTFAPIGSDTAQDITFHWTANTAYQYFYLQGPEETRRLHELTLYAVLGSVTVSHPLTTLRDQPEQHPAAAVSFDDTIAALDATDVQVAIEKLAASSTHGVGLSAVINNVTTGVKFDIEMPFAGSIGEVKLLADQSGSMVVDLWKSSYANFPPTVANTITASAKPTLGGATKYRDATLTGWTKTFSVGDIIRVNVDSASTLTRVTLAIRLVRSTSSPVLRSIQPGFISQTATMHAPSILGGLLGITLPLITRTATATAPSVFGGGTIQAISLARIARTAVPHAPTLTGTAVGSSFYISPTGNDANAGTSVGSPWRTIQKFVAQSSAGDTLYCRGGNYTSQPEVSTAGHSGTASQPITIKNYASEVPNFVSPSIYIEGGCSYWVIDGITISGPIAASSSQLWIGNGRSVPGATTTHHITVKNCSISKSGGAATAHGIYLSHKCANVTIEDNLIYGLNSSLPEDRCAGIHIFHGINPGETATATLVQRNIIRRWPKGIVFWDEAGEPARGDNPTATAQFLHNTFQNCDFHIDARYHSTLLVRDNVGDNSISQDLYDPYDYPATTQDHNYWSQTLTSAGALTAGSPAINGALDGSDAGAVPYP